MSSIHLSKNEMAAIDEVLLMREIGDPITLVGSVGYDVTTFFENHDWSHMDFRNSSLEGVSFAGAILYSIKIWSDQVSQIVSTSPKLFKDPEVHFRETELKEEDEERPINRAIAFQKLEPVLRKILIELQNDGRMTNVELSKRVGISAPLCLRRVRELEEQGFVRGYFAGVDPQRVGFEFKAMVTVVLEDQSEDCLSEFEELCRNWPLVREAHLLNGEVDYLLKCVALDDESFQEFLSSSLQTSKNVKSVIVSPVIQTTKQEIGLPLAVFDVDVSAVAE